jgi:very-short-patch-repair endonuclease
MALYEIGTQRQGIDVSVPRSVRIRRVGITLHQRSGLICDHVHEHRGIRVTTPALTLVDFASTHARNEVEAAVNAADRRDLIDAETLRTATDEFAGWPGAPLLRDVLDRLTFTYTDSELERCFRPIARRAGAGHPLTQQWVNGYRVDFYWPDLGLVVETDGLRYHRTAAQQAEDRRRDQAHTAAGLTPLRFAHGQIRYESGHVESTLRAVVERLARTRRT